MENLEQILQEKTPSDAVMEVTKYIVRLCQYGKEIERLTDPQKNLYYIEILFMEVNNGGFNQFFHNSSGNFTHETLAALKIIKVKQVDELLEKAIKLWPEGKVPKDRMERDQLLEEIEEQVNDQWEDLDKKIYNLPRKFFENLNLLLLDYIQKNKDFF